MATTKTTRDGLVCSAMGIEHISNGTPPQVALLDRGEGNCTYRVTLGKRSFLARHFERSETWIVENEHGTRLSQYGRFGLRVVAACEKFAARAAAA